MWAKTIAWVFGTATGRALLLGAGVALGVGVGWYAFSTHYYNKGMAACQARRMADANAASVAQGEKNIANNLTSSDIGKATDAEAARVAADAEAAKNDSKETIRDVYKKPPVTAPVAVGSCVHPLDERVQDRIGKARAAAVEAGSPAR